VRSANARVLLIAAVLVVLAAAAGLFFSRTAVFLDAADAPGAYQSENVTLSPAIPKPEAARAYLRIQVGSEVLPLIPLTDGGEYTLTQPNGCQNILHTTASGAVMHFSTCDNQNCIQQGEVTLDNRSLRVLGSMIVCLPNQVVLELLSPDEVNP